MNSALMRFLAFLHLEYVVKEDFLFITTSYS